MIRKWLLRHRWINELLKFMCALFFAFVGHRLWLGVPTGNETGDFVLGLVAGIMVALTIMFVVDIAYSIPLVIRAFKGDIET